jgi:hypothetical protein
MGVLAIGFFFISNRDMYEVRNFVFYSLSAEFVATLRLIARVRPPSCHSSNCIDRDSPRASGAGGD